jgi:hypothetical protein
MSASHHGSIAEPPASKTLSRTDTPSASRLSVKDALTVFLSTAALLVAVSTLYITQFRTTSRLQARLAEFDTRPDHSIVGRFTISNAGNRATIILGAHYMLSQTAHSGIEPWGGPSDPFDPADGIEKAFPILLQPRELRLVDLPIPATKLVSAFDDSLPTGISTRDIFLAFRFVSLDADGEAYDMLTPTLAKVEVSSKGWRSIAELQYPRYAAIDLLTMRASEYDQNRKRTFTKFR